MSIEKGKVIGSDKAAVDVTSLTSTTSYELLRKVGPYYYLTDRVGVVLERIRIDRIRRAVVVVSEQTEDGKFEVKVRQSTAVIRRFDELTPRPGFNPVLPGVRP